MNQGVACDARQTCSMIFQIQSRRKKIQVTNRLILYILIVTIGKTPVEPKGTFKMLKEKGMKIKNYKEEKGRK
jgi:hypothetical protein